jgi:hypothetical protein
MAETFNKHVIIFKRDLEKKVYEDKQKINVCDEVDNGIVKLSSFVVYFINNTPSVIRKKFTTALPEQE